MTLTTNLNNGQQQLLQVNPIDNTNLNNNNNMPGLQTTDTNNAVVTDLFTGRQRVIHKDQLMGMAPYSVANRDQASAPRIPSLEPYTTNVVLKSDPKTGRQQVIPVNPSDNTNLNNINAMPGLETTTTNNAVTTNLNNGQQQVIPVNPTNNINLNNNRNMPRLQPITTNNAVKTDLRTGRQRVIRTGPVDNTNLNNINAMPGLQTTDLNNVVQTDLNTGKQKVMNKQQYQNSDIPFEVRHFYRNDNHSNTNNNITMPSLEQQNDKPLTWEEEMEQKIKVLKDNRKALFLRETYRKAKQKIDKFKNFPGYEDNPGLQEQVRVAQKTLDDTSHKLIHEYHKIRPLLQKIPRRESQVVDLTMNDRQVVDLTGANRQVVDLTEPDVDPNRNEDEEKADQLQNYDTNLKQPHIDDLNSESTRSIIPFPTDKNTGKLQDRYRSGFSLNKLDDTDFTNDGVAVKNLQNMINPLPSPGQNDRVGNEYYGDMMNLLAKYGGNKTIQNYEQALFSIKRYRNYVNLSQVYLKNPPNNEEQKKYMDQMFNFNDSK